MQINSASCQQKHATLRKILRRYKKLAIAFSGGVDSTLLLAVAQQELKGNVLAMTAQSAVHSQYERTAAEVLARRLGAQHVLFTPELLDEPEFTANNPKRCYYCKKCLFKAMRLSAQQHGFINLAHGANCDDNHDYRPGMQAAIEMGIAAPLCEAGLTKADIRQLARQMGLPNWNRPAMACLATRIPYGIPLDRQRLATIEQAESVLREAELTQCRVRYHHHLARIEVGIQDLERMVHHSLRKRIVNELRALGFRYVCLDLEGYVSGKMNRDL